MFHSVCVCVNLFEVFTFKQFIRCLFFSLTHTGVCAYIVQKHIHTSTSPSSYAAYNNENMALYFWNIWSSPKNTVFSLNAIHEIQIRQQPKKKKNVPSIGVIILRALVDYIITIIIERAGLDAVTLHSTNLSRNDRISTPFWSAHTYLYNKTFFIIIFKPISDISNDILIRLHMRTREKKYYIFIGYYHVYSKIKYWVISDPQTVTAFWLERLNLSVSVAR